MAKKKDLCEKLLLAHNDMFVQCWNSLGRNRYRLDVERLRDAPTEGVILSEAQTVHGFRDVSKVYECDTHLQIITLGLENQTDSDKYMAVRILSYTAQHYEHQRRQKTPHITPIVIRVLYFGYETRWNAARCLSDLVGSIPQEMKSDFIEASYDVIEFAWLSDEEVDRLSHDLRALALFLRDLRLKRVPMGSPDIIHHREELFLLLKAVAGVDLSHKYQDPNASKGGIAMCEFFDQWKQELVDQAVADKQAELDSANAKLDSANAKLDSANAKLNRANVKLDSAQNALSKTIAVMLQNGFEAIKIHELTGIPLQTIQQAASRL